MNKGVIQRIGRGLFKIGKEVEFVPNVGRREIRIYNQLKQELPYLDSCVWNFDAVKEFTQHIPNLKLTFVEVERHSTESVFYLLREKHKHVLYKTHKGLRNTYSHNLENAILIRPLVTEAPVQETGKLTTITIEKMLVDLFSDDDFEFLQGSEMTHIFKNAFQSYTINQNKMLRYADRKQKKESLLSFLKNYNLAVL